VKQCSKKTCKQVNPQPLSSFYKNRANSDGLSCSCKDCHKAVRNPKQKALYQRKWNAANPDQRKGHWLRKYWPGSTWEEALTNYNNMVTEQGNTCALCKKPETAIDGQTGRIRDLCVDHCHKTGNVRGLLCSNCNRGIGHLKDSADLCYSAGDYLRSRGQLSQAGHSAHCSAHLGDPVPTES
jgi:hypothetical protein